MAFGDPLNTQHISTLYSEHHGWLQGWLRKKLGCSENAADLAQDTFVRLISSRRDTQTLAEPRAFLTTIARGLLVDHFRRQDIRQAYEAAVAAMPEALAPSPEEKLLIMEALLRIDALLEQLPAQTRDIFLCSQLDGQTYAEIALQTGLSLATIKRHMKKAFLACLTEL